MTPQLRGVRIWTALDFVFLFGQIAEVDFVELLIGLVITEVELLIVSILYFQELLFLL